jgi:NAD(P)-dependent dehydrogenase (short-subunit alcohol dehydrogenase family)
VNPVPGAQPPGWVLVAGGSGGLGAEICHALAQDGWDVALTYRGRRDAAEKVAARVREAGRRAAVVQVDLADDTAVARLVETITGGEPLSGVVYAAGPHIPMRLVADIEPALYREQFTGDAFACYNLLQPSLRRLRETRGSIVALSTAAVDRYFKADLLSAAPKAAVQTLIRAIATEEGRHGVRANCVGVGIVQGDGMWQQLLDRGDFTEKGLELARRQMALGRFGSPTDIAEGVRFLMSPRANWITGQALNIDGGYAI